VRRSLRTAYRKAWAALALVFLAGVAARAEPASKAREYAIKAAFLYQMIQYIEWPDEVGAAAEGDFVVGVLGVDPFGAALEPLARRTTPWGQPIRVARYRRLRDVKECRILFVARSEAGRLPDVVARLRRRPVLLVADSPGLAERGAHVNFFLTGDRVRFEINLDAARRAALRISAKLLRLARIVEDLGA